MSPSTHVASRTRWRRRAVLLWSVAGGLLVPAYFLGVAEVSHLGWDFRAYHAAADAVLRGDPFVGISAGVPGVTYVYPPISVVLFLPQAALGGWRIAFAAQTLVNLGASLALAALTVGTIESHRGRLPTVDRLLIAGVCLLSAPAMAVFGQGQVDALIAVALAGSFVALERDRGRLAGVALAGAALVKVFPAALGLWLAWRRAWDALAAAVVTGLSGLALGGLWFGLGAYRRYLAVLAERSRVAEFAGTVSPNFFATSLYRPLSQLLPGMDPILYAPVAVLVVAPPTALVAGRDRDVSDRLRTFLVAVAATVLISPASNALYVVYVYFPLLCLLHLDRTRRGRSLALAGTAAITFPVQPAQVATVLAMTDVPAPLAAAVTGALRAALTVASIPLVGLLALVGWCALRAARRRPAGSVDVRPASAD